MAERAPDRGERGSGGSRGRCSCRGSTPARRSCRRRPVCPRVDKRIAVARDAAADHLEADELARQAVRLLHALERRAADEVALVELDDPAEAGLERVRRLVDVVAVERAAAPRGAACRARRGRSASTPSRLPSSSSACQTRSASLGRAEDLEAVLAGVAGARDGAAARCRGVPTSGWNSKHAEARRARAAVAAGETRETSRASDLAARGAPWRRMRPRTRSGSRRPARSGPADLVAVAALQTIMKRVAPRR